MKKREVKETDQDEIEKAYQLILKLMNDNPQIEETLWACALWSAMVNGYLNAGASNDDFSKECHSLLEHYKTWW